MTRTNLLATTALVLLFATGAHAETAATTLGTAAGQAAAGTTTTLQNQATQAVQGAVKTAVEDAGKKAVDAILPASTTGAAAAVTATGAATIAPAPLDPPVQVGKPLTEQQKDKVQEAIKSMTPTEMGGTPAPAPATTTGAPEATTTGTTAPTTTGTTAPTTTGEPKAEAPKPQSSAKPAQKTKQAKKQEKAKQQQAKQEPAKPTAAPAGTAENVAAAISASNDHKTFTKLMEASGLTAQLQNSSQSYTVYAPSDAAFAKLSRATLDDLQKPQNKERLTKILSYHIVPGPAATSSQLAGKTTTPATMEGQNISVTSTANGVVTLNGSAHVTQADARAQNGVVHTIDTVMIPQPMLATTPAGTPQPGSESAMGQMQKTIEDTLKTPPEAGAVPGKPATDGSWWPPQGTQNAPSQPTDGNAATQ